MSADGVWPVVTKQNPCPICGVGDWCCIGDRAVKCMRIQSDHACPSGGWYHKLGNETPKLRPLPKKKPSIEINCASLITSWSWNSDGVFKLDILAKSLGLDTSGLIQLMACWAPQYDAWAFPMRDGAGKVVGIRLRSNEGKKWTVTGTHPGIFISWIDLAEAASWRGETAFICEGPTDTAACITIGLKAIGKPSCNYGNEFVIETLKRLRPRDVVILADRDEKINKITGKPTNIGLLEARKLKDLLNFRTLIVPPPMGFKDVREFVRNGGNKTILESLIRSYTWT